MSTIYTLTHPWSLISDYDFFIGDAAFGGSFAELILFIVPFDPVGAIALSLAALLVAAMVLVWSAVDRRQAHSELRH